jgi:hypothetical protein
LKVWGLKGTINIYYTEGQPKKGWQEIYNKQINPLYYLLHSSIPRCKICTMALYAPVGCLSPLAPSHAPGQPLLQRSRLLPPVRRADTSPAPLNATSTHCNMINRMNSVRATTQRHHAIWRRPAAHTAWPVCSSPYAIQGTEPTIAAARYGVGSEILGSTATS